MLRETSLKEFPDCVAIHHACPHLGQALSDLIVLEPFAYISPLLLLSWSHPMVSYGPCFWALGSTGSQVVVRSNFSQREGYKACCLLSHCMNLQLLLGLAQALDQLVMVRGLCLNLVLHTSPFKKFLHVNKNVLYT